MNESLLKHTNVFLLALAFVGFGLAVNELIVNGYASCVNIKNYFPLKGCP